MLGVVGGCYWDDGKDASAADGESGVVDVWEAGEDLLRGFDVGEVIEVEDYEGGGIVCDLEMIPFAFVFDGSDVVDVVTLATRRTSYNGEPIRPSLHLAHPPILRSVLV